VLHPIRQRHEAPGALWKTAPFRASKKPRELRENPAVKLVLVGVADSVRDHEADENGHMRETEDPTGLVFGGRPGRIPIAQY